MVLIKSAQVDFGARARTLGKMLPMVNMTSDAAPVPIRPADSDPQLLALEAEIEGRRQKLEAAQIKQDEHDTAINDAYERGLEEGARNVTRQAAASIELLSDGIDRAVAQLAEESRAMEQLAVALARTALTRIFGDRSHCPEMVIEIIHHQLEMLAKDMVLHIDVASADFKDAADHANSFAALEQQGISIQQRDDLASGDCEMRLRLGTLDIGLDQQWSKIRAHLDQLVQEAPHP